MAMHLQTGMTPRAWRMICYCVFGLCIYCFTSFLEVYQDYRMRQIDEALKMSNALNPVDEVK